MKLGDLVKVLDTLRKPITKRDRVAGEYPYYGATGIVDWVNDYIFEEELVLIGEDGAKWESGEKTAFIVKGKYWVNNHAHVVKPDKNKLLNSWLAHYLYFIDLKPWVSGLTVPKLNQAKLKSIPIPIPSLPIQEEIVSILDDTCSSIDKAKANVEKNIENAKDLFQSKLNEIFSQTGEDWEINAIKDVGETQTGSTPPTKDKSNYGNFIPFTKPPHFNKNGTLNTGDSMLSELGLKKSKLIKANSVLMVCIGATIGKTAFSKEDICSNQQINALTPKENYAPKLLYYAMISTTFQNKVKSEGKSAQATLPIINKSKWSNLKINLPQNIIKQKEIVECLDIMNNHVQSLLMSYKEELENLEELKKSILQKAFAGELTNKKDAA